MPVTVAERAELESFFQSRRGTRVLIPSSVAALTTYFASKGTTLRELTTLAPEAASRLEDFRSEWFDAATAATITDKMDANNLVRWICEDDSAAVAGGLRSGKAFAVADALIKRGFTIDRATELTISSALAQADAGDTRQQCRSVEVVWMLYLGQLPGDAERKAFAEMRAASARTDDVDPTIDIRLFKAYYKQVSVTTVPTLERALRDKTGRAWQAYYSERITQLNNNGYDKAATQFIAVVSYARKLANNDITWELTYLVCYFFDEHLGRGLPEIKCNAAAHVTQSGGAVELRPTAPSEKLQN